VSLKQIPKNERPQVNGVINTVGLKQHALLANAVLGTAAQILPQTRELTAWLPDALNYMSHASNAISFGLAYGLTYGIARVAARFNRSPRQVALFAGALGATALIAANVISETHTGLSIVSHIPDVGNWTHFSQWVLEHNTADPADAALGVVTAIGGAAMAAADVKPPEPLTEDERIQQANFHAMAELVPGFSYQ